MPALTLGQITDALSFYAPTDGSLLPRINQVLSRIHNMGAYRDLTVQYSLPVAQGVIYLPRDADAVLHAIIDGQPSAVRSLWHDFKAVGTSANDLSWGLVDAGFSPLSRELAAATDTLYIVPSTESATRRAFSTGGNASLISVKASDGELIYPASTDDAATYAAGVFTFGEPVLYVESIRFSGLLDRFDLRTTSADPDTTIASVGPGTGVSRYRKFRVPNVDDGKVVHVLCKRSFIPLVGDSDISYVGNIGAIKQGLHATVSEDGNDVERAQMFWGTCFQLMEEEASSTRGAAVPRLTMDPHGVEGRCGIRGMM